MLADIMLMLIGAPIQYHDIASGVRLAQYTGHKHSAYKQESCLNHRDSLVMTGDEDGCVYTWKLVPPKGCKTNTGNDLRTHSRARSQGMGYTANSTTDQYSSSTPENNALGSHYKCHAKPITSISHHPSLPIYATASNDTTCCLWQYTDDTST